MIHVLSCLALLAIFAVGAVCQEQLHIRVNQLGFAPVDVKTAVVFARAVYHDDVDDYSTNEPTMDGTAAAILLFALK